ncbi:unnamed protein product [Symbiodinium necroappetens]|uniref:Uncharacterized protein n=1 Tax=Symbiodinium necroappetens TaxID=1628268 RepID=A0A812XBK8_9DINO|nr:unnamed protein product [Symbiodinium necroappetens]
MSDKALWSMQRAARLKETEQMFRQIDDLEEFRLWVERDPEAFKKSIKTLREMLDGDEESQPDTSSDMSRMHDAQNCRARQVSLEDPAAPPGCNIRVCVNYVVHL